MIKLGDLDPVRLLTYEKHTVDGFLRMGASKACLGEVVNIGNGKGISIWEPARMILTIMGIPRTKIVKEERRVRPSKSEVFKLICNNEKAKSLMGWSPQYSLDEGLEETVLWIKYH